MSDQFTTRERIRKFSSCFTVDLGCHNRRWRGKMARLFPEAFPSRNKRHCIKIDAASAGSVGLIFRLNLSRNVIDAWPYFHPPDSTK